MYNSNEFVVCNKEDFKKIENGFYLHEDQTSTFYVALKCDARNIRTDEHIYKILNLTMRQYRKILRQFGPITISEFKQAFIKDEEQGFKTVDFLNEHYKDNAIVFLKLIS